MDQLSFEFVESFVDEGVKLNKLGKFKTKLCSKCRNTYEATLEYFCKNPSTKDKLTSWCKECTNKHTTKVSHIRKEKGLCRVCLNESLPNRSRCAYHTVYALIKTGTTHGRFTQLVTKEQKKDFINKLIKKLEYQQHKCAITGVYISLGDNAHLDHIKEVCNGGSCELDNLQWVSAIANFSKPRKYKEESELNNEGVCISNF